MPEPSSANSKFDCNRISALFRNLRSASALSAIAATITVVVLGSYGLTAQLLGWYGLTISATALRFKLYTDFVREPAERRCARSHSWLQRNQVIAGIAGASWGLLPLTATPDMPFVTHQFVAIVPAFVLAAAANSYGTYPGHFAVFGIAMGLTFVSSMLYTEGSIATPIAILFMVGVPIMVLLARRFSTNLLDAMLAHEEADSALERLRQANEALTETNIELAEKQDLIAQEEELARFVFGKLTENADGTWPGVQAWNQPMGTLSGDLVQVATDKAGDTYVFVGDFTGHGLPAALGAVPTSTIFKTMAEKGLPIPLIVTELNEKLHQLLPIGYFCCATVMKASPDRRRLEWWNGGLPPVIARRGDGDLESVPGTGLPLGVIGRKDCDCEIKISTLDLQTGDEVYVYTDGLTEATDVDGHMWGRDHLLAFLARNDVEGSRLDALKEKVLEFVNLAPPSDDVSIVAIIAERAASEASVA